MILFALNSTKILNAVGCWFILVIIIAEIFLGIGFYLKCRSLGKDLLTLQLLFASEVITTRVTKLSISSNKLNFDKELALINLARRDIEIGSWDAAFFKVNDVMANSFYKMKNFSKDIDDIINIADTFVEYSNKSKKMIEIKGLINMIENRALYKMIEKIVSRAIIDWIFQDENVDIINLIRQEFGNFFSIFSQVLKEGNKREIKDIFKSFDDDSFS
jgi:hypothetical protein